jgi:8-oxo-dGTP pyrophosphatase MutT (NUDIX family)
MPGGYLEPGETTAEGAARELAEETGLLTTPHDLRPIYRQAGCTTFTLAGPVTILRNPMSSVPFEGYVAWVPAETIAAPSASFGRTNRKMLRDLELL